MIPEEKEYLVKIIQRYHTDGSAPFVDRCQVALDIGWLIGMIMRLDCQFGGVGERFKPSVLKAGDPKGSGGSNPSPSDAWVAQLVEHSLRKRKVIGSIPIPGSCRNSSNAEHSFCKRKAAGSSPASGFYFLGVKRVVKIRQIAQISPARQARPPKAARIAFRSLI